MSDDMQNKRGGSLGRDSLSSYAGALHGSDGIRGKNRLAYSAEVIAFAAGAVPRAVADAPSRGTAWACAAFVSGVTASPASLFPILPNATYIIT
ncbi:hypothetical protein, partial [Xanthomonas citri]|uniref:hypothetical protein n=1 Tax=Xanthomonas citri TaxID=346 RepID=UPI0019D6E3C2